ncbi:MAG: ABC transporter ATP-binding protein [Polyangiaceae bacterium]
MSEAVELAPSPAITGGEPVVEASRAPRRSSIRVRHLFHKFGNVEVLRDVDFEVAEGEVFGFIGPNGAGKTTTIRVMATLLEPMAGRVEIEGIDVARYPDEVRRIIGYMPDHAGVYERVTVREYLEFFADAYRVRTPRIVSAVLDLTDIGPLEDRLVATMSKGQKQRLQLARILLHDPKVLILDEPASDLDPRARIEIRALLGELRNLGKTVLLSSHILTELADVCTSVGILERGHIVVSGPIQEIGARFEQQRANLEAARQGVPVGAIAPVVPKRSVKLRVLGELDAARAVVDGAPKVIGCEVEDGALLVEIEGGDAEVAALVRHLVEGGVGIVGVEQKRADLERLFLDATRGEMG